MHIIRSLATQTFSSINYFKPTNTLELLVLGSGLALASYSRTIKWGARQAVVVATTFTATLVVYSIFLKLYRNPTVVPQTPVIPQPEKEEEEEKLELQFVEAPSPLTPEERMHKAIDNLKIKIEELTTRATSWLSKPALDYALDFFLEKQKELKCLYHFPKETHLDEASGEIFLHTVTSVYEKPDFLGKTQVHLFSFFNHWVVLKIDPKHNLVEYYDPKMDYNKGVADKGLEEICTYLKQKHGQIFKSKKMISQVLQPDSYNCGVWAYYFIKQLLVHGQVTTKEPPQGIDSVRKEIKDLLVQSRAEKLQAFRDMVTEAEQRKDPAAPSLRQTLRNLESTC